MFVPFLAILLSTASFALGQRGVSLLRRDLQLVLPPSCSSECTTFVTLLPELVAQTVQYSAVCNNNVAQSTLICFGCSIDVFPNELPAFQALYNGFQQGCTSLGYDVTPATLVYSANQPTVGVATTITGTNAVTQIPSAGISISVPTFLPSSGLPSFLPRSTTSTNAGASTTTSGTAASATKSGSSSKVTVESMTLVSAILTLFTMLL